MTKSRGTPATILAGYSGSEHMALWVMYRFNATIHSEHDDSHRRQDMKQCGFQLKFDLTSSI